MCGPTWAAQTARTSAPPSLRQRQTTLVNAVEAATKIQRFWRRQFLFNRALQGCCGRPRRGTVLVGRSLRRRSRPNFVAVHHAAARIQRAWKVHSWRQKFVDFSEHELGWLGSLEWLQRRNLLYGTELADPEDVRWWQQQRERAPLDREVDPWGFVKLRNHLHRIWYGRVSEEMETRVEDLMHVEYDPPPQDAFVLYEGAQPSPAEASLASRKSYPQPVHEPAAASAGVYAQLRAREPMEQTKGCQRAGSLVVPMNSAKTLPVSPWREKVAGAAEIIGQSNASLLKSPLQSALIFRSPRQHTHSLTAARSVAADAMAARLQTPVVAAKAVMMGRPVTVWTH